MQRSSSSRGTKLTYKFAASGFPAGETYLLWLMQSGDHKTLPLFKGYSADKTGKLVCPDDSQSAFSPSFKSRCIPFEGISFEIDHFHKGEPLDVAVISTDGAVRAYARTFPFPIQAQDGRCALNVAMGNSSFTLIEVLATGFEPSEQVTVSSTLDKAASPHSEQASPQGKFAHVIDAKGQAKKSGSATFTATGSSCHLTVTYDWGEAAMKVQ